MAAFKLFEIDEQIEIITDMLVDPETGKFYRNRKQRI